MKNTMQSVFLDFNCLSYSNFFDVNKLNSFISCIYFSISYIWATNFLRLDITFVVISVAQHKIQEELQRNDFANTLKLLFQEFLN